MTQALNWKSLLVLVVLFVAIMMVNNLKTETARTPSNVQEHSVMKQMAMTAGY